MDLTLQRAADLLAIRPRTRRDQLRHGAIRGRKADGRWLIRKADLPPRLWPTARCSRCGVPCGGIASPSTSM